MIIRSGHLLKSTLIIILFFTSILTVSCQKDDMLSSKNNFHIRKGYYSKLGTDQIEEYKFRDVPTNISYLTSFPWESIRKVISEDEFKRIRIEYWIYSSVSEAEIAMVENLEQANLMLKNTIEYPIQGIRIGDNCWIADGLAIAFIRNNVRVSVLDNGIENIGPNEFERIARIVDKCIIESSDKVANLELVPTPVVHSVDIISSLPEKWKDKVKLKIHATDPNGKKLYYRKLMAPGAIISENVILNVQVWEHIDGIDWIDDSIKANIKIWVWNEDHLVTLVEVIIPFGK